MPKQMRVMYDTEFLERPGGAIAPISIGMEREDGLQYYAVYQDMPTLEIARNSWLMNNVMSSIDHVPFISHTTGDGTLVQDFYLTDETAKPQSVIRQDILAFTVDIWPEWWAWYGAYDHVVLSQTFGRMIDLPGKFPMLTHDLKSYHKRLGLPDLPVQPEGLHNALEDAKFNWVKYRALKEIEAKNQSEYLKRILDKT